MWCGVVWCGVVWCGVPKALLPNGNGRDALHMGNAEREGGVSERVLCVVCEHLWQRAAPLFGAGRLLSRAALGTLCRSASWCYQSSCSPSPFCLMALVGN